MEKINKLNFKEKFSIKNIADLVLGKPYKYFDKDTTKWNIIYPTFYKEESTPSFKISERNNCFKCFATGHYGDGIKLYIDNVWITENRKITEAEAIQELADKLGFKYDTIEPKANDDQLSECEKDLIKVFLNIVSFSKYEFVNMINSNDPEERKYVTYLEKRGLDPKSISDFFDIGGVDWEKTRKFLESRHIDVDYFNDEITPNLNRFLDNRIVFPVEDESGNIRTLFTRSIEPNVDTRYLQLGFNDNKKYSNLDRYKWIFGLNEALPAIRANGKVILVEGVFDVFRLRQIGIQNVVALMHSDISKDQIKLLENLSIKNIAVMLDGDETGQTKNQNICHALSNLLDSKNANLIFSEVEYISSPDYITKAEDPDEYFKGWSYEEVENYFEASRVDYRLEKYKNSIKDYKSKIINLEEFLTNSGRYLQYKALNLKKDLQCYIKDNRPEDLYQYNNYFIEDNEAECVFFMNELNATHFYCRNLLKRKKEFEEKLMFYRQLMNELNSRIKEEFDKKEYSISEFLSIYNRTNIGERLSNFNISISKNNNTLYKIKLNFIDDYLIIYKRFENIKKWIKKDIQIKNDDEYHDVFRIELSDIWKNELKKKDFSKSDKLVNEVMEIIMQEGLDYER